MKFIVDAHFPKRDIIGKKSGGIKIVFGNIILLTDRINFSETDVLINHLHYVVQMVNKTNIKLGVDKA